MSKSATTKNRREYFTARPKVKNILQEVRDAHGWGAVSDYLNDAVLLKAKNE